MRTLPRLGSWLVMVAFWAVLTGTTACAADLKLHAQLVWGTDEQKPAGKDFQPLSPSLREKVRQLRWKNYFVVHSETASVAGASKKQVNLSERCSVGVCDLGNGKLQVQIFNLKSDKPKEPVTTREISVEKLQAGHVYVFGGDSKDRWDDAWLVIVTKGE